MAFGASTFQNAGAAANDLFQMDALRTRATGRRIEAQQYDIATDLARKNEDFVRTTTQVKDFQTQRQVYKTIGQQQADVAGGGFGASGSALDLLRESASQGALVRAVGTQQGAIEEQSYEAQAKSYMLMKDASNMAADADEKAADRQWISFGLHTAAAITSLIPGGELFSAGLGAAGDATQGGTTGGVGSTGTGGIGSA